MSLSVQILALVIRHLNTNTDIIRRPDSLDNFVSTLCTGKTVEQRQAEALVESVRKSTAYAKNIRSNRSAKKNPPTV